MSNDLNQKNSIAGAQGAAQAAGDAAAQSAGNNAAAGTAGIGGADVSAIMKKYDRESNTRIWTGRRKQAIRLITAAFSLWCIYVTLFATFLEEIRLTSFLALIIMLGFLTYPAKKGEQKPDYMPWYDILFMILGTGAFLYFTFNAQNIIQQGTRFAPYQIVIGIIGLLALIEITRRCVGLPILFVALFFLIYALSYGLTNPDFFGRVRYLVRNLFYTKEGIFSREDSRAVPRRSRSFPLLFAAWFPALRSAIP